MVTNWEIMGVNGWEGARGRGARVLQEEGLWRSETVVCAPVRGRKVTVGDMREGEGVADWGGGWGKCRPLYLSRTPVRKGNWGASDDSYDEQVRWYYDSLEPAPFIVAIDISPANVVFKSLLPLILWKKYLTTFSWGFWSCQICK